MNTTIALPTAIANYFDAANAFDPVAVAAAFTPDAVVADEDREHRGHAAIKDWNEEVNWNYRPQAEPLEATEIADQTVVTARVSGYFPGSPVQLRFSFTLAGDKIAALSIEA